MSIRGSIPEVARIPNPASVSLLNDSCLLPYHSNQLRRLDAARPRPYARAKKVVEMRLLFMV